MSIEHFSELEQIKLIDVKERSKGGHMQTVGQRRLHQSENIASTINSPIVVHPGTVLYHRISELIWKIKKR